VLEGLGAGSRRCWTAAPARVGVESTIVGLTGEARLLRPGGLPVELIEAALGTPLLPPGDAISAPGQLASHYAPRGGVRLEATQPEPGEVWIGFGPCPGAALSLSPTGDMVQAAANLFALLHRADEIAGPKGRIAVAPIPDRGLGRAINDRLRRASAPRD
jgi:L-threonylcarbamoyladenylate synthase